ncbi:MAG: ester cyclase [Deltaproteobacteria bacterium]|nr:ester cyclase [Deltaproteobacteria bacterium]
MKKYAYVVPLVLVFCFPIACQDKAAMAKLEKFSAQAKVEEQNKVLLSRMWEMWNKGNFEAWKLMHADEYVYYSPSNSTKGLSREETIEMGKAFFKSFPDATTSIEELIVAGDKVITRWILRGTHKGEYAGISATGNKVENSGIMITRIENGKIVEDKEDYDTFGMMTQLGMELKPVEAKKK